jgi:hypothetical protein
VSVKGTKPQDSSSHRSTITSPLPAADIAGKSESRPSEKTRLFGAGSNYRTLLHVLFGFRAAASVFFVIVTHLL